MLNQNQSWNLSLEGAWNSTTVNGITENRTFNEVYEILTSNSNPLTHDRKGNLTQNKDSSQYTWDYNNQLSHAVNASSESASYTYDALGRRISKQVNGTLTVYINIGYQIATEYQSTDGMNFTEKQSYVYATYIDDPLALIKASGERFYYHSNGQFSISKITDEYKNVVEAYAYSAYGDVQILQSYAGLDNPYYFTGRQLDQETGLFYFRARYYDAKLGQFIARDPIGYVDGFSLYRGYFAANGMDWSGMVGGSHVSDDWPCCNGIPYNPADFCCDSGKLIPKKQIAIKIQSNFRVSDEAQGEFNRILNSCLAKCQKKCVNVYTQWEYIPPPRVYIDPAGPYGTNRFVFNPDGFVIRLEDSLTGGPGGILGNTVVGEYNVQVNLVGITTKSSTLGVSPENLIGLTIAHEVLHHAIGGTWGHPFGIDFVDSKVPKIFSELSPEACSELCDELDID